LGIFVFAKNPKGQGNRILLILTAAIVTYEASYIIGVNISDPYLSRFVFMFNLSTLFAVTATTHLLFWMTNDLERRKKLIWILYSAAALISVFFILNPDSFLLPSTPRLYFANFFAPGKLYFLGDIYFYVVLIFFFYHLVTSYKRSDAAQKNRLKYFVVTNVFGYAVALLPAFLLYGIPVDPFWGFLMGLYTIPFAYAIIRYDLIDIRIIAKRALGYALGVGGATFLLIIINSVNDVITGQFPFFPAWAVPFISGLIGVAVSVFVWNKLKEVDILKYEFINVVTHKFRTPLTYIKWSLDTLGKKSPDEESKQALSTIQTANTRLVELTNALVGLTSSDNNEYKYAIKKQSILPILSEIQKGFSSQMSAKNLALSIDAPASLPEVAIDSGRMLFAFQTIIENALKYTQPGGSIAISCRPEKGFLVTDFKDSGIGIEKEELPHVFSKFFRGSKAKQADTEGMGIGLYLTKRIVERHGGRIEALSEGKGKGTTISVALPLS